jgi:hypothetical protein
MSDEAGPEQRNSKLRWVTLGEAIAVAALVVSAVGVWISWKDSGEEKAPATTAIVERQAAIPLVLRGRIQDEGQTLEISPVESSHSLQSLTVRVPSSGSEIRIGGDGQLSADAIESALPAVKERDKKVHGLPVLIEARYVEAGADKRAAGSYILSYRWEGGGLFGGRSLRFTALTRA